MSGPGRKLSPEEAELWAKVANTVTPLRDPPRNGQEGKPADCKGAGAGLRSPGRSVASSRLPSAPALRPSAAPFRSGEEPGPHGLDSSWDRRLARGLVHPDFTLDLHGASLEAAHGRLLQGLSQAKALGARVVLLIAGRPRPVEPGQRGNRRGAIRAKVVDWLAASEHASDIAAIRNAHRRHGGPGALYLILKRRRG